jgi:hypothetical protein
MNQVQVFFVHRRIISAVKRAEFVSDRISYIILRGHWYHCFEVHSPTEDKIVDMKNSFYKEVERVFDRFPKYQIKILLGEINAEVGKHSIGTLSCTNRTYFKTGSS